MEEKNGIYILEYAIHNNKLSNIKKILKKYPNAFDTISTAALCSSAKYEEFKTINTVLKCLSKEQKKKVLLDTKLIIILLHSNNIDEIEQFFNKYMKYIDWNIIEPYILRYCIINTKTCSYSNIKLLITIVTYKAITNHQ